MLEFSLGITLRGYLKSILDHFQSSKSKISKIHIFRALRDDRVVLTTGRGSGICFWPANRAIVVRFRWFLHHWKALFKVDEGCHTFRGLGTSWHNGNSTCSPPKVEFSIQILLVSVYATDIDAKNVEEMSNKSELEKIFLLTLVQNAKCYRITRQENPEFLGEFHGGAKTTSNSGVISFEYREIWEGYAWCVSSLTYQEWMKYQVIGNQINQRGKNLKFALNR